MSCSLQSGANRQWDELYRTFQHDVKGEVIYIRMIRCIRNRNRNLIGTPAAEYCHHVLKEYQCFSNARICNFWFVFFKH